MYSPKGTVNFYAGVSICRYLYWTDWAIQPFVGRAWMDGSNFEKKITRGIYWPNAITIDYYTDRLYVADAKIDNIMCVDSL